MPMTPKPKPTINGLKQMNLDKPKPKKKAVQGLSGIKKSNLDKPKHKVTVKPKATPTPKFTAPSVAEFRKSAAYKTDSMGYKEYVDTMYQVHQAKYKKK